MNYDQRQLQYRIYVMQAFLDGKKIQKDETREFEWQDTQTPEWQWAHTDYRVHPSDGGDELSAIFFSREGASFSGARLTQPKNN